MQYRPLGKTGVEVSEIGFGAWGIGGAMWQGSDDAASLAAVRRAVELGVNFFDTALAYGDGHSERLLSQVLGGHRESVRVATKVPPKNYHWPAVKGSDYREVFPPQHIIECTEQSLRNLRKERIDLQQLHVWNDEWAGVDEIWSAVERLKQEGKILAFGISVNDHEPSNGMLAVRTGRVDSIQVIYNIFDQSPETELLPLCRTMGIGVLARVPFDEGGLTGKITPDTTFPADDWRNDYFQGERKRQVFERTEKLRALLDDTVRSLPELALRFCLSHSAVSTVIPGMRTIDHVESNVPAGDGQGLPPRIQSLLRTHRWQRNFYR
jgi:aryl-alcohol dehydrogenase-like predicted oxidoreductase